MEPPSRTVTRPALATNCQHPPPKARSSPRSWTRRRHWRGLTVGTLRSELAAIAVPSTGDGRNRVGDDFALTAGWGDAVIPALCRGGEREYTPAEREALGDAIGVLGDATVDVYLNDNARWSNVPAAVWNYSWAATRSSRSGCPIGKARSWADPCCRRKRSTSPTRRGGSGRCWGSRG